MKSGSEKSTVCMPGVVTASKYALSLLSFVGNATRIDVLGIVVPLNTKQKPFTPFATVSYGICGGPSFSSSPTPAPQAPVAVEVIPDVHITPPTLGNAPAVGKGLTLEQFTPLVDF